MIWFKHFTGYRNDPKVRALREEFKSDGYALPIMMVEIVAESIGATNFHPYLTYSPAVWAEFVCMDVRKFKKIVARMQDINLFEVTVEPDGKITFGTAKLLEYCDEYTRTLKRQGKIPRDKSPERSPEKSHKGSRERSPVRVDRSRVEKKRLTPEPLGTDGPEAPSGAQVEDENARAEGLKAIRETIEKIGGNGAQKPERRVVELEEQLPEVETPEDLTQETVEKQQGLARLAIEPPLDEESIAAIINAWTGYRTGRFDQYALADTLNRLSIMGVERSKVYETLGVV